MSELIKIPCNIYEALLLQLAPLAHDAWSYDSINTSSSCNYYDYKDDKEYLRNELAQLRCNIA